MSRFFELEVKAIELKETARNIKALLKVDEVDLLPARLMDLLHSSDKDSVFDSYVELAGELESDYLQRIYQFWCADRKDKKQDFTPPSIGDLIANLLQSKEGETVYDCCAGTGALTIALWRKNQKLRFICEELDEKVIPVLLFNLSIRNIEATVIHGDVLRGDIFKCWRIEKGDKYSSPRVIEGYVPEEYDAAISNPPYNIQWSPPVKGLFEQDVRFDDYDMPPEGNANYAFLLHILHRLKPGAPMAMILPNGVLTVAGVEGYIRKRLVETGAIESVITLSDRMFESTSIPTCVISLRKGKNESGIMMVDARKSCHHEFRYQRGEGDKAHSERVYNKKLNVFLEEDIGRICNAILEQSLIDGFSALAPLEKVMSEDYVLSPARYVGFEPQKAESRPYTDIVKDLARVTQERNAVKVTINQTLARALGWDTLFELMTKSNEGSSKINALLQKLGVDELSPCDYIGMSANAGVFKIENKTKDGLSSILRMFMSSFLVAFEHHIYFLNDEENRYLAELRDALLPDLISGKISVDVA